MKPELTRLARRYKTALRQHLKQGLRASLQTASRIGRDALALRLATLELARIHERAFFGAAPTNPNQGLKRRAENFFVKASTPIIEARHSVPAQQSAAIRLKDMTDRWAAELKTTNRELQRAMAQREVKASFCQKDGKHQTKCLGEALKLQKRLRLDSHRVLAALENERKQISHELQDEIAQGLLGINVRLHTLREQARSNPEGLQNEIAIARRLVVQSAQSVQRFARKLDTRQERQSNRPDTAP